MASLTEQLTEAKLRIWDTLRETYPGRDGALRFQHDWKSLTLTERVELARDAGFEIQHRA